MDGELLIKFRYFKNKIASKLTKEELENFEYLIDLSTYINNTENNHYLYDECLYDVILVDGSKFRLEYWAFMNYFTSKDKINHPQAEEWSDRTYGIRASLVKKYRKVY